MAVCDIRYVKYIQHCLRLNGIFMNICLKNNWQKHLDRQKFRLLCLYTFTTNLFGIVLETAALFYCSPLYL